MNLPLGKVSILKQNLQHQLPKDQHQASLIPFTAKSSQGQDYLDTPKI
jgi:hypothetical protein